jgi:hypothetical protein
LRRVNNKQLYSGRAIALNAAALIGDHHPRT